MVTWLTVTWPIIGNMYKTYFYVICSDILAENILSLQLYDDTRYLTPNAVIFNQKPDKSVGGGRDPKTFNHQMLWYIKFCQDQIPNRITIKNPIMNEICRIWSWQNLIYHNIWWLKVFGSRPLPTDLSGFWLNYYSLNFTTGHWVHFLLIIYRYVMRLFCDENSSYFLFNFNMPT